MATNVQDAISQSVNTTLGIVYPTPVQITFAQSPYSVQASDRILYVKTSGGNITIVMPSGAARVYDLEISDIDGQAATHNITVQFQAGETADAVSPYVINTNWRDVKFRPVTGGYVILD